MGAQGARGEGGLTDTTAADLLSLTPDQLRQLAETQAQRIIELEERLGVLRFGFRLVSALLEHGCSGSMRVSNSAVKQSSGEVSWHRVTGGYVLATGVPE